MNISIKDYDPSAYGVRKFQEGGEMPVEEGAAPMEGAPEQAPEQGGDPMQELMAACQQALETQDCQLAMQVCQVLMQMAGGQQQAPDTQPVYRRGGILSRRIRK